MQDHTSEKSNIKPPLSKQEITKKSQSDAHRFNIFSDENQPNTTSKPSQQSHFPKPKYTTDASIGAPVGSKKIVVIEKKVTPSNSTSVNLPSSVPNADVNRDNEVSLEEMRAAIYGYISGPGLPEANPARKQRIASIYAAEKSASAPTSMKEPMQNDRKPPLQTNQNSQKPPLRRESPSEVTNEANKQEAMATKKPALPGKVVFSFNPLQTSMNQSSFVFGNEDSPTIHTKFALDKIMVGFCGSLEETGYQSDGDGARNAELQVDDYRPQPIRTITFPDENQNSKQDAPLQTQRKDIFVFEDASADLPRTANTKIIDAVIGVCDENLKSAIGKEKLLYSLPVEIFSPKIILDYTATEFDENVTFQSMNMIERMHLIGQDAVSFDGKVGLANVNGSDFEVVTLGRTTYEVVNCLKTSSTSHTCEVIKTESLEIDSNTRIKFGNGSIARDFYGAWVFQKRLGSHQKYRVAQMVGLHKENNNFLSISEESSIYSLQDVLNAAKELNVYLPENVVAFYATQMLEILLNIYNATMIHGSFDLSNLLVCTQISAHVKDSRKRNFQEIKNLQLRNFDRSVDISLLPEDVAFVCRTTNRSCVGFEILSERPWRHQIDLIAAADAVHQMLHHASLDVELRGDEWKPKNTSTRVLHNGDLWDYLFANMLNSSMSDTKDAISRTLNALRSSLSENDPALEKTMGQVALWDIRTVQRQKRCKTSA